MDLVLGFVFAIGPFPEGFCQAVEKGEGIFAQGTGAVPTLLDNNRRQAQRANGLAVYPEILGQQSPGAGRIALGGIKPQSDDQKRRIKGLDSVQGLGQRLVIPFTVELFGQRQIQVKSFTLALAQFLFKAGKIGIGKARVTVQGNGEHIGALVKNILLAVAMMVIDIQYGDFAVVAEILGSNSIVIEIAEAPEGPVFGMVARRPDQGIGKPPAVQYLPGRGKGTVYRPTGCRKGIAVNGGKGIDAVIAAQDRRLLGRPRLVADGKDVWIQGFPRPEHRCRPV